MYHDNLVDLADEISSPKLYRSTLIMLCFGLSRHGILIGKRSKMTSNMVDCSSRDSPCGSYEQRGAGHSSDLINTLRSLKAEIRSCKEDNDIIMQEQKKQE